MAPSSWIFLDTGCDTGDFNMRFDEMTARRLAAGEGSPTVRLYRWQPWAISVGYNQSTADLDLQRCMRDGVDVVRRPTGGRAILHAEELTYSVVMYARRKSVLQVYNDISRALVHGLRLAGVDAALQRSQPNFPDQYRHPSSSACFTSSARYEIEWQGRKLVGSAQRRFSDGGQDVVLQHGSILCGPAHRRLSDYIRVPDAALLEQLRAELRDKTVDLSEIRGEPVDPADLAACIRKGFELEWELTFADGAPFDRHHHVAV